MDMLQDINNIKSTISKPKTICEHESNFSSIFKMGQLPGLENEATNMACIYSNQKALSKAGNGPQVPTRKAPLKQLAVFNNTIMNKNIETQIESDNHHHTFSNYNIKYQQQHQQQEQQLQLSSLPPIVFQPLSQEQSNITSSSLSSNDYIMADYIEKIGTRIHLLETELKFAWSALDLLSGEFTNIWSRLEKLENISMEQQFVVSHLRELILNIGENNIGGIDDEAGKLFQLGNEVHLAEAEAIKQQTNRLYKFLDCGETTDTDIDLDLDIIDIDVGDEDVEFAVNDITNSNRLLQKYIQQYNSECNIPLISCSNNSAHIAKTQSLSQIPLMLQNDNCYDDTKKSHKMTFFRKMASKHQEFDIEQNMSPTFDSGGMISRRRGNAAGFYRQLNEAHREESSHAVDEISNMEHLLKQSNELNIEQYHRTSLSQLTTNSNNILNMICESIEEDDNLNHVKPTILTTTTITTVATTAAINTLSSSITTIKDINKKSSKSRHKKNKQHKIELEKLNNIKNTMNCNNITERESNNDEIILKNIKKMIINEIDKIKNMKPLNNLHQQQIFQLLESEQKFFEKLYDVDKNLVQLLLNPITLNDQLLIEAQPNDEDHKFKIVKKKLQSNIDTLKKLLNGNKTTQSTIITTLTTNANTTTSAPSTLTSALTLLSTKIGNKTVDYIEDQYSEYLLRHNCNLNKQLEQLETQENEFNLRKETTETNNNNNNKLNAITVNYDNDSYIKTLKNNLERHNSMLLLLNLQNQRLNEIDDLTNNDDISNDIRSPPPPAPNDNIITLAQQPSFDLSLNPFSSWKLQQQQQQQHHHLQQQQTLLLDNTKLKSDSLLSTTSGFSSWERSSNSSSIELSSSIDFVSCLNEDQSIINHSTIETTSTWATPSLNMSYQNNIENFNYLHELSTNLPICSAYENHSKFVQESNMKLSEIDKNIGIDIGIEIEMGKRIPDLLKSNKKQLYHQEQKKELEKDINYHKRSDFLTDYLEYYPTSTLNQKQQEQEKIEEKYDDENDKTDIKKLKKIYEVNKHHDITTNQKNSKQLLKKFTSLIPQNLNLKKQKNFENNNHNNSNNYNNDIAKKYTRSQSLPLATTDNESDREKEEEEEFIWKKRDQADSYPTISATFKTNNQKYKNQIKKSNGKLTNSITNFINKAKTATYRRHSFGLRHNSLLASSSSSTASIHSPHKASNINDFYENIDPNLYQQPTFQKINSLTIQQHNEKIQQNEKQELEKEDEEDPHNYIDNDIYQDSKNINDNKLLMILMQQQTQHTNNMYNDKISDEIKSSVLSIQEQHHQTTLIQPIKHPTTSENEINIYDDVNKKIKSVNSNNDLNQQQHIDEQQQQNYCITTMNAIPTTLNVTYSTATTTATTTTLLYVSGTNDDESSQYSYRSQSMSSRRQSTEDSIDTDDEYYCYELRKLQLQEQENLQLIKDNEDPIKMQPKDEIEVFNQIDLLVSPSPTIDEQTKKLMNIVLHELKSTIILQPSIDQQFKENEISDVLPTKTISAAVSNNNYKDKQKYNNNFSLINDIHSAWQDDNNYSQQITDDYELEYQEEQKGKQKQKPKQEKRYKKKHMLESTEQKEGTSSTNSEDDEQRDLKRWRDVKIKKNFLKQQTITINEHSNKDDKSRDSISSATTSGPDSPTNLSDDDQFIKNNSCPNNIQPNINQSEIINKSSNEQIKQQPQQNGTITSSSQLTQTNAATTNATELYSKWKLLKTLKERKFEEKSKEDEIIFKERDKNGNGSGDVNLRGNGHPGDNPFYSNIDSMPDIRPRRKSIPLVSELVIIHFYIF